MKTTMPPDIAMLRTVQRGFSLMEVLIALGIAMVLMSALAGIFATTVSTRQAVEREGRKIENARISLDTLMEDLRLAGYWGNYTPAGGWYQVEWQALTALEKVGSSCTVTPLTSGWQPTTVSTLPRLPIPILGFESHAANGVSQTISASVTDCLPYYQSGTDVLVIRRARTASVTTATAAAFPDNSYIQVSGCLTEIGANDMQVGLGSDAFLLHELGNNSVSCGVESRVWPLITRIYYVARHNDTVGETAGTCPSGYTMIGGTPVDASRPCGDNAPTLKMIDLSADSGSLSLSQIDALATTVAPNIVDFHVEFGIEPSGTQWSKLSPVAAGQRVNNGTSIYTAAAAGTTGTKTPMHTTGSGNDGGVTWNFAETMDGSVSTYVSSTIDPLRLLPDGVTTQGTALASPWGGGSNWHDVMSTKLWVVARDPDATRGVINSKSFALGGVAVTTATINGRGVNGSNFRYRSSASTVKIENMSARREAALP